MAEEVSPARRSRRVILRRGLQGTFAADLVARTPAPPLIGLRGKMVSASCCLRTATTVGTSRIVSPRYNVLMRLLILLMLVPRVAGAEAFHWVIRDAGLRIALDDGEQIDATGKPVVLQEADDSAPRKPAVLRMTLPAKQLPDSVRA